MVTNICKKAQNSKNMQQNKLSYKFVQKYVMLIKDQMIKSNYSKRPALPIATLIQVFMRFSSNNRNINKLKAQT